MKRYGAKLGLLWELRGKALEARVSAFSQERRVLCSLGFAMRCHGEDPPRGSNRSYWRSGGGLCKIRPNSMNIFPQLQIEDTIRQTRKDSLFTLGSYNVHLSLQSLGIPSCRPTCPPVPRKSEVR